MRRLGVFVVAFVAAVVALAAPAAASNDTFFPRQWALEQIGAPRAWTVSRGAGITIGIIDTGVDSGHPDLAGKVVATADCVGRPCAEGAGADTDGHGTAVAGVAAAVTDNGQGVAGVAPDARVVVAKVLGSTGVARVEDVDAAIRWAVGRGARVINLSLGDSNFAGAGPLRTAVEFAWSRGAVPVLASGNYGSGSSQNYGTVNALVVGATDRSGAVPAYSSPVGDAKWGLVAPGGSGASGVDNNVITTARGGGYASAAGTSMAVPHVSAAIALLLAQGMAPATAVSRLLATLDRVACGTGCQGRLNVANAVGAGAAPAPTTAPPTTPPTTAPPAPKPTAPPATVRPTPTTSTSTSSTTTTTPTTVAPPPTPVEAEAVPTGLAAGPPGPPGATGDGRNPAVLGVAVVLLLGVGGAVGGLGARVGLRGAGAR